MREVSKKIIMSIFVAQLISTVVFGVETLGSSATEKTIKEFLDVSGYKKQNQIAFETIIKRQREENPEVPDLFWTSFKNEMDWDELLTKVAPVYWKYYSEEDLKAAIRFYRSPSGRRLAKHMPLVTQENIEIGFEWGQSQARKIMKKLSKQEEPAKTQEEKILGRYKGASEELQKWQEQNPTGSVYFHDGNSIRRIK